MASFFDKLKKGMDTKNTVNFQENSENLEQDLSKEPSPGVKKSTEPKIEVEKPSMALVSTSLSDKKAFKESPKTRLAKDRKKANKKRNRLRERKKIISVKQEPDKEKNEAPREKKWFESEGELTVDIYQTDKEIVIQSAVAGIRPEDLDISIEDDMVTIKGIRERLFEKEKKNYFYQECYWGSFSREIILPEEVDPSRIKAVMKQGVLTIRIPKVERKKKRRVTVEE